MQPVRMAYTLNAVPYTLNLIDTPGHVDFSYEVSRSLAAVEGAILLIDATKGVQAQTIANLEMAQKEGLIIIPAVNKIDIATPEQLEEAIKEMAALLKISEQDIYLISGKTGENVENLLGAVIKKVPAPVLANKDLRALIFDSEYDFYKGVVAHIRVIDGEIAKEDKIYLMSSAVPAEVIEIGYFKPELIPGDKLESGEIGYIATGLKDIEKCRVGDTVSKLEIRNLKLEIKPLRGYMEPQPMVFASFYPVDPDDYDELKDGLGKLKLNDASLIFEGESLPVLGRGFRCGFLGMLHLEIVSERLRRDYGLELVITSPAVIYKIIDKKDAAKFIYNVSELPDINQIKEIQEPWVKLEIILPNNCLGSVVKLFDTLRGIYKDTRYLSEDKLILEFEAPLSEIIAGFYDKLKSVTSGYGSMSYQVIGYRRGDLIKLDILLGGDKIDAFSKIVPSEKTYSEGKKITKLLKEIIPAQLFTVPIQAAVGGKIIARETKRAMRKDVTGYLYGGDYTRKRKLLEKQKRGKKKMAKFGKINLPPEVFLKILKAR
jgi:GTP-binding protein LepA